MTRLEKISIMVVGALIAVLLTQFNAYACGDKMFEMIGEVGTMTYEMILGIAWLHVIIPVFYWKEI